MNKKIIKLVAFAAAVTTVSAFAPNNGVNVLGTKEAYAAEETKSDKNTIKEVKSIEISNLKLYEDDDYDDKIDDDELSEGSTYYAKTSRDSIKVNVDSEMSEDKYVRIFKGTSNSNKGKEEGKSIDLSSGTNTITVRIYEEDKSGKTVKYSDDYLSQYKFKIKCTSSSDDDDDDDDDDVYLKSISLSEGTIDFSKKTNTYNVKVPLSADEITIKAKPEDEEDDVHIDGSSVDDDDNWKKTIDLKEGKNKIEVKVDDDDNKRTYTLNITRGNVQETSSSIYLDSLKLGNLDLKLSETQKAYNYVVNNETDDIEIKAEPKDSDYTVTIDGNKVDSDDSYTKKVDVKNDVVNTYNIVVKNSNGNEQTYTLNVAHKNVPASKFPVINNGTVANTSTNNTTATTQQNTTTANTNSWVSLNGNWRYYDDKGNLVSNTWVLDQKSGKEYYLDSNGNMSRGWLLLNGVYYYLGQDGAKKTGWQKDGSTWYYMDSTGKMLSNQYVGQYRLGANGAWIQ